MLYELIATATGFFFGGYLLAAFRFRHVSKVFAAKAKVVDLLRPRPVHVHNWNTFTTKGWRCGVCGEKAPKNLGSN